ncbi:hypothetical protein ACN27G_29070 [Plantactinospora sp. WMMB334]|uniref:hypothetical protein n=1 Tax=Plantactinospora sp. WMMB334 TaxID=3404119 RepID=UPI003B9534C3
MSRFWFRLAEVLPIAEHALACPQHRITSAQAGAGDLLRPALLCTRIWGQETLRSNGVPVWYDRHQDAVHGAQASTWWHRATNRRGTDEQPLPEHRILSLRQRHRGGRPPLITLLREGARRRAHWFAINTDPALADRPERFELHGHRDDIVPADAHWQQAVVTAAAVADGRYPALVADGYSTRGDDVLPRFDRRTVETMIADLDALHAGTNPHTDPMPGEYTVLRMHRGTVIVLWEHDGGSRTRLVEIDRVKPDPDGYYSIGAYHWPWTRTEGPVNAARRRPSRGRRPLRRRADAAPPADSGLPGVAA